MGSLRTFIAIDLPDAAKEAIEKHTARLRQSIGDELVRWVPPHNMHLTLKFLGDIAASHLDFLKQSLTQAASSAETFEMQIGGLGSFPNVKRPRVIWIGLHAPATLTTLQRTIESAANRLGYPREERPFSPHLTLGRVKQNLSPAEQQRIRTALEGIQLGNISTAAIDSIHLYKSDLQPGGSVYTRLFSASFNNKQR